MTVAFRLNGAAVEVDDDGANLLDVLRGLGVRSAKDGCSPQGQCGCCTVHVDGVARVACVTPARRVAGRAVTTLEGLPPAERGAWAEAFSATGASQCGFCTPGIIMRLSALAAHAGESAPIDGAAVRGALVAHLCRCTGWQTIVDAAAAYGWRAEGGAAPRSANRARDDAAAARRASIEGRTPQRTGAAVALGGGGFADDTAPADALVAVPDGAGGWAVAPSLHEARRRARKVQGRRSTLGAAHPLEVPAGEWDVTLRTTWVEPAYLEPDASWCEPGGEPASSLANGGAFGAKSCSPVGAVARRLADEHDRPVRVLLAREDVVRWGPKRPPVAAGVRADGTGIVRVARTEGIAAAIRSALPDVEVEEIDVAGPPTSRALRAAGWAEASALGAAARWVAAGRPPAAGWEVAVGSPWGGRATASITPTDAVTVTVSCGAVLDEVVLRSYCIGAAHMALGWVRSEAVALDELGRPVDLTIRSFGILRARDMPPIDVEIAPADGPAVNGSDAVFAAVAAAAWITAGLPRDWPISRLSGGVR